MKSASVNICDKLQKIPTPQNITENLVVQFRNIHAQCMQENELNFTFEPPNAENKSSRFATLLSLKYIWGWRVDVGFISQTYSLSPALYPSRRSSSVSPPDNYEWFCPSPLLPPSLFSSAPLISRRDVINHVDTLLVLILRVPSFPLVFICLRLLQSLSLSFNLHLSLSVAHSLKVSLINCSHRKAL